ncbi:MAG: outer membrane lipoprotein-sorting protein [Flavobacteriales bacterium]|nr:outer membrane lipoprotein-sorting protein [Flavobacteriales bacterium]MBL4734016.1 outer membrane lipoprotein-sorting protein [Flavobacteriales bacterium]PCH85735.1 MAG: outer membrane lipoprotein-sorting protein [Flavobacteriales bacterium]
MKTNNLLSLSLFMGLMLFSAFTPEEDGKEILRKADARMRGTTAITEMSIKIVRPSWTREMTMKSWSKGDKLAMVLITSPAKEKGIVFLKRNKEIWNWIPNIERTVKLPPSMMGQSWMGTDFSNDDLVKESSIVHDYTHVVVGDTTLENRLCWKIELTPKPDAAVVWGKIHTWVDKKDYMQMRTEFYDEDDYLISTMSASEVRDLGGKLLPTKLEMVPEEEEGKKTIMTYKSMEFDKPIEDNFFTTQNMKRVR